MLESRKEENQSIVDLRWKKHYLCMLLVAPEMNAYSFPLGEEEIDNTKKFDYLKFL